MRRRSALLFAIILSTPLLAQSRNDGLDVAETTSFTRNVATYCETVEHLNSVPRIFARIKSIDDSSGWVEYGSRAAWNQAGRPHPVAFVWYQDSRVVRVAITPNETSSPLVHGDYCYREDGSLARLRSIPSTQHNCEQSRYQCSLVLREVRFYPPNGPAVTTFSAPPPDVINGPLLPEHTVVTYVPLEWPAYLHVADLPFGGLFTLTQPR